MSLSNLRQPPLRFLLYLEWILLAIVALSELPRVDFNLLPRHPWITLPTLLIFTLLGLRLPTGKLARWLYTGLEFLLVLIATFLGGLRLFILLYVVLVMRNSLIFPTTANSILTGLAFLLFLITQMVRINNLSIPRFPMLADRIGTLAISVTLLLGLALIFLQLLIQAVLAERQSREQLAIANEQLRRYALRIEDQATLEERNRIAREIHDSLGHHLTVFNLHLSAALRLLPTDPEEAIALLEEVKQLGATALQEVRQSVGQLRTDPLQGNSLETALQTLASEVHKSTGVLPDLKVQLQRTLPRDVQVALYRIVQESLTNICKYAQASAIQICLTADAELQLTIADNGEGFDLSQNTTGFGLQGMKERVTALGGTLTIRTAPGQGCEIIVCCPLPAIETF